MQVDSAAVAWALHACQEPFSCMYNTVCIVRTVLEMLTKD